MLLFVRNIHYSIRGDGVSCRQPTIKWFQGGEISLYYCNFLLQQKKKDKERVNGTLEAVENERRARHLTSNMCTKRLNMSKQRTVNNV